MTDYATVEYNTHISRQDDHFLPECNYTDTFIILYVKEQTLMARKDKCTGPDRSLQLQAGIVVIMIIRGLLYPDGGGVFLLYSVL